MNDQLEPLACTVELKVGEKLSLPAALVERVGPGRWMLTVSRCPEPATRRHDAFLNGFADEDEGLYDDLAR